MPTNSPRTLQQTLIRESLRLLGCLLFGLFVLPAAIFWVGQIIFGEFGGGQLGDFYASLGIQLRLGNLIVWFLILAPYLIWQTLRAVAKLYRMTSPRQA